MENQGFYAKSRQPNRGSMQSKKLIQLAFFAVILSLIGGCGLILEYPITSASVGVWGTTGKGPADHAVSYALNEDCETLRAVNSEAICKKTEPMPRVEVIEKSFNPITQKEIYQKTEPVVSMSKVTELQKNKKKVHNKQSKRSSNRTKSR